MDTYDKARRDLITVGKFTLKWGLIAFVVLAIAVYILSR
jgi:hypothetical protein